MDTDSESAATAAVSKMAKLLVMADVAAGMGLPVHEQAGAPGALPSGWRWADDGGVERASLDLWEVLYGRPLYGLPVDVWDREMRLWACDCAARVVHIAEEWLAIHAPVHWGAPTRAIEVARRYAHGEATWQELKGAKAAAWNARDAAAWAPAVDADVDVDAAEAAEAAAEAAACDTNAAAAEAANAAVGDEGDERLWQVDALWRRIEAQLYAPLGERWRTVLEETRSDT